MPCVGWRDKRLGRIPCNSGLEAPVHDGVNCILWSPRGNVIAFSVLLSLFGLVPASSAADKQSALAPQLLTDKKTYDGQPAVCKAEDGTIWTVWVGYDFPMGDQIFISSRQGDTWSSPQIVNSSHSQIVRPTVCAAGKEIWVFWTETAGKDVARVLFSKRHGTKWSAPEQLNASTIPAQNQEVTSDGQRVFVTWQEFRDGQYDIVLRTFENGKWSEVTPVTKDMHDDWDPALARDSKGRLWVAWSSYRGGDYDLYLRQADKPGAEEIRLSARGEYDLHPALTTDDKGRLWVAWDSVTIPRHGSSGGSTITGANKQKSEEPQMNDPENPDQKALEAQIRIVCVDGDKILHIPKTPRSLKPPEPYKLAHTAMPRISVDASGQLWVAYRALIVKPAGEKKTKEQLAKMTPAQRNQARRNSRRGPYWWDVFVQSFNGNWSDPQKLPESDGTSEEAVVVSAAGGALVIYQMEHRAQAALKKGKEPTVVEDHGDHHHEYGRTLGSNGDIYAVHLKADGKGEAAGKSLVVRKAPIDKTVKPRVPRESARYQTEVNGKKYTLLWGDLHKHSNVSRCSSGNEPAPEEHYKYAHDVCQYDFLAMSDHAEHTSEYNWWRLQKLADLYNVPGWFSVLYGYEWTASWPIGHHNVIFPSRPSPILRSNLEGSKDTKQLCDALAQSGKPALVIPHTMADPRMGTRWDYHDERFERLAEMFQACRGSYEYDGCPRQHTEATAKGGFYQDGLAKDYKLGTICSSDHGWGTAYAVVYATENSRQGAWQGLYDRRCYGSTTYGLIVDFRCGKHFMGEEFSTDKPPQIKLFVRGSAPIREVAILSNGKIVHSQGDEKNPIGKKELNLSWTPGSLPAGTTYYYARVIQEDDEMAWTSPVWVTNKALKVSDAK